MTERATGSDRGELEQRSPSHSRWVLPLALILALPLTACDGRLKRTADRLLTRSQARIDSLSRENAGLKRQMVMFERISAEKDTLLREVREAHVLIEGVAQALRRIDGDAAAQLEVAPGDSLGDGVVVAPGDVAIEASGEFPAGEGSYRDAMLRRLEGVRARLAELEDSSRVRGERLLEAARDNDRLREEVEAHLRTIDDQKEIIATYLVRIAELETQVTALADSTRRLTEENGVLADSLSRLTSRANAAWYVIGTRDQLVRAGVLSEEGGILGFGRSLSPARAMARNVFTRIDRLRDTAIALPVADEYRIVSRHDPDLVDVHVSRSEGGRLRIRDPERFWSASTWLIIVYE